MNTNTQTAGKTATGGKWFYQYQDEIRKRIEGAGFSLHGYILYQEVVNNRYFECWDVQDTTTGRYEQIIATVHKNTGFIFIYTSSNKF